MDQETIRQYINSLINRAEEDIQLMWAERLNELLSSLLELYAKSMDGTQISWTQVQRYNRLEKELNHIAQQLEDDYAALAIYLLATQEYAYTESYIRHIYLFELGGGVDGMEVSIPTEEAIRAVLEQPINRIKLKTTMERHRRQTLQRIRVELTKSIQAGEDYNRAAKRLTDTLNMTARQAKTTARTELKRAATQAGLEASVTAEMAGARMQKMWNSTLDHKTRDSHQHLDGKVVKLHENFKSKGNIGAGPGLFTGATAAGENINCRCSVVFIVNGTKPDSRTAKDENGRSTMIDYQTYEEWIENNPEVKAYYEEQRSQDSNANRLKGSRT